MTTEFRNDLKEFLILFFIACIAFFFAYNCEAQDHNNGLTLDMMVYRTPVYDSVNDEQSKSLSRISSAGVERVRLIYPNKDIIILQTAIDTIEVELISIWQNCHFVDRNNPNQFYTVIRDRRKKSFYYTFTPAHPLTRPGMYSIHVEPYLPLSGRQ